MIPGGFEAGDRWALAGQLESVPCGHIVQDKDNSRKEEKLSPVQIRDKKTTRSSFLRSRRPSNCTCTVRLLRGQIGRGHHHVVSDVDLPIGLLTRIHLG